MRLRAGGVVAFAFLLGFVSFADAQDTAATGCLDLADGVTFAGWALDPDFTGPVWVHIYVDGQFAGATLADKTRADVGAHAFSWQPGTTFAVGAHTVHAYAIGVDPNGLVTGSNPEIMASPKTFVVKGAANDHQAVGYVDLLDDTSIAGWASDGDTTGPIAVHFYVDGQFVGWQLADSYRADVGAHAFQWTHPSFGPGDHTFVAYAIGVDANNVPTGENPPLSGPQLLTQPRLWPLTSADGQITVVIDSLFGGAITQISDSVNFPGQNLIDGDQAGACFQPAFWLFPRKASLPPGYPTTPDWWQENPTLAGFYQDGHAGNPIGIWGTNATVFDADEFIRREGGTVHFKSRFIQYGYVVPGLPEEAPMSRKDEWDTPWYFEEWASFDPTFPHTLVLKSKITYVGTAPKEMNTRQLPIIFSNALSRVAYWQSGQKVVQDLSVARTFDSDSAWAAFLGPNSEAGIGLVLAKSTRSQNPAFTRFAAQPCGGPTYALFPGALPDLASMGVTQGAAPDGTDLYVFQPGGTFEWTTWHPVGDLASIKQVADALAR
jgi:hypothetical protein